MLRVTTGVEAHTHEFIATAYEDQKFGISLTSGDAFIAVRQVLARPGTMRLVGLHSHIGSQIFDVGGFDVAARRVLRLVAQVRSELDHTIDRKSTRLNSSHVATSYAVFCVKKKREATASKRNIC